MGEKAIWEYLKTLKNGVGETTVSVAVGSTTTGAEGTNANVVNSGDDVNVILDFTIPRGNTGSKGVKGDTGDAAGFGTPTASVDGNVGTPSVDITASGSDTAKVFNFAFHNLKGIKGDKGDTGDAFHIVKTYASVAAMNADYSGTDVKIGEYVMITSSVEDPDNAKVYIKGSQAYEFVVDMSGATGIKGDKGDTGATGNGIATVTKTSTSGLVDTYTITYTDGTTSNFTVTNGAKGDTGDDGNGISNAVLNQDYTLTLTFTDGTTYTTPSIRGATGAKGNTGATGNGIASIAKTGTSGLVDTYTITFTDGTTTTFTVTNGAKGDKGDTFTYDDLTAAQKAEIKADLSAFYKKEESNYVTTQTGEATIPIGITGFRSTDILFVDINGLDLTEGEDYTVSGTNVVLDTPISSIGQTVHFLALRAVQITAQDYAALKGDAGENGRVQDVTLDGTSVVDQQGVADIPMSALLDMFYPVGSWYSTSKPQNEFDPNTAWGGTWELLDEGVFLSSAGANHAVSTGTAKDGGSPDAVVVSHTHPDTISFSVNKSVQNADNITEGGHKHTVHAKYQAKFASGNAAGFQNNGTGGVANNMAYIDDDTGTHTHSVPQHSHTLTKSGSVNAPTNSESGTGKNLPPYKNAYMWHRTA